MQRLVGLSLPISSEVFEDEIDGAIRSLLNLGYWIGDRTICSLLDAVPAETFEDHCKKSSDKRSGL